MQSHLSWRVRSSRSTTLPSPFLHHRRTDVVVVDPALVAGVVRRVDVDALDLAVVVREQGFERLQIVAVDDEVVVQAGFGGQAFGLDRFQLVVRHEQVEILHQRLALKIQ